MAIYGPGFTRSKYDIFVSADSLASMGILTIATDITARKALEVHLRHYAETQRLILQQRVAAQESERRRLSMDVHDGPLQSLGVSLIALDRAMRRLDRGDR